MRARSFGIALLLLALAGVATPGAANELRVTSAAALGPLPPFPAVQCTGDLVPGPCGLEIVLEGDNETTFLVTGSPNQEDAVRVSFMLDPNDVPLAPDESLRLVKVLRKVWPKEHLWVWLQRNPSDTGYNLDLWGRNTLVTFFQRIVKVALPDAGDPYTIDLEWILGDGNGILRVAANGELLAERTDLFNSIFDVHEVHLGVIRPEHRTASTPVGSIYVDNFRIDRISR